MSFIEYYFDFVLHLNTHLAALISQYGSWIYPMLFLIIFLETGIIFIPFLPGESLLFAIGTLSATTSLNVHWLAATLILAAILGGFVNYLIGALIGKQLYQASKWNFIPRYIDKAHAFYEKHGVMTIIIARLIPIIRTYAPFVAGIARMDFLMFALFNIIGGVLWIALFLYVSHFFGNIPIVKQHFSMVILGIILISVVPLAIEIGRNIFNKVNNSGTKV